jgi:lipopolysaccharide/colanic/teichoic acid biosynthesis glycosyltransferase
MYIHLKRFLDALFSSMLLVILSPVLIIFIFLILIVMGRPVFFIQVRAGRDKLPFSIYKFRTMNNITSDKNTDKQRLTRLGSFLRKTSIDEWPQLLNILKGDMSFIGPRPLLMEYLPFYNSREISRYKVRPGMTSLAGVKGRSSLTWEEQFEMDACYVETMSFFLDMKIFFRTIPKVLVPADVMVVGRKNPERFDVYRNGLTNRDVS